MEAVFVNKLVEKFRDAMRDAERANCEIECFILESEEENMMLREWHERSNGYPYLPGMIFEYEGIPIKWFCD